MSEPPHLAEGSVIRRLTSVPDWQARQTEFDAIFFEASLTKSFPDAAARTAFRERWLGCFLDRWPSLAHVALSPDQRLLGYIVGAHGDPARDPVFAGIGFYRELATVTPDYPAHLHINLAPVARNLGLGRHLIEAFVHDARDAALPGVHLVTGRFSRNRTFYARCGFESIVELEWGGTPLVMLGRRT